MVQRNVPFTKERRYPRRALTSMVEVTYRGRSHIDTVVDVSEGGMLIRGGAGYKLHDRVNVSLVIPGEMYLQAITEVIYIREPLPGLTFLGLRFMQLTAWDKLSIRRYVRGQ